MGQKFWPQIFGDFVSINSLISFLTKKKKKKALILKRKKNCLYKKISWRKKNSFMSSYFVCVKCIIQWKKKLILSTLKTVFCLFVQLVIFYKNHTPTFIFTHYDPQVFLAKTEARLELSNPLFVALKRLQVATQLGGGKKKDNM